MEPEDHYEVEEIVKRQLNSDGSVKYLVKWKDWGNEHNSWVKATDMSCASLIENYEKNNIAEEKETLNPFQRGYKAEEIKGFEFSGQPMYLLKFIDKMDLEWVSNEVLKKVCPQILIQYYESCIQWHKPEPEESDDENKDV